MRADDGFRVLPEQRFKILVPDISQPVCRDEIDENAARLQIIERSENRVMLQIGGEHMVARRKKAVNCNIERLGGVHREDNVVFARAGKELRELLPRFKHRARGSERHTVRAPGSVSGGQNRLLDGFGDLRRFMERRGRVIQIDHTNPPAKIAAHVEPMSILIA